MIAFRGKHRAAVRYLLDTTPLGSALDRFAAVIDAETLLTIDVADDDYHTLSTGEQTLLEFCASLTDNGMVSLADIAPAPGMPEALDADCRRSVVWMLGIAAGCFEVPEVVDA